MRIVLTTLSVAVFLLAPYLFFSMLAQTKSVGGSALSGEQVDGTQWVSQKGRRIEVSADDYAATRRSEIAVLVVWPFAMLGTLYLTFSLLLPRLIYQRGPEEIALGAARVVQSGPARAQARIGGKFGLVDFSGPLIRLSVHPDGLHVKPLWLPPFAIAAEEIGRVERVERWYGKRITVAHTSRDVKSPLIFHPIPREDFMVALDGLAEASTRPTVRGRRS